MEVAKRIAEVDKRTRAAVVAALKKGTDAMKLSCEALKAHRDWVCAGKPVDDDGSRRLNKKGQLCDCEVSPADCGHHGGVEVERLQLNEEVRHVSCGLVGLGGMSTWWRQGWRYEISGRPREKLMEKK